VDLSDVVHESLPRGRLTQLFHAIIITCLAAFSDLSGRYMRAVINADSTNEFILPSGLCLPEPRRHEFNRLKVSSESPGVIVLSIEVTGTSESALRRQGRSSTMCQESVRI